MNWLKLVLGLIELLSSLLVWARERQLLDAGAQQEIAKALQAQADAITNANNARKEARSHIASTPKSDGLFNDGFRRD